MVSAILPPNPAIAQPARGPEMQQGPGPHRIKPHEVEVLTWAIDQEPRVNVRAAFVLYILTGVRKSELLAARRRDIDWQERTLRLPDTKSGEAQSIPLSAAAQAILRALPVMSGNSYIFRGERRGAHPVNIDKAWGRARKVATVRLWFTSKDKRVSALIGHLTRTLDRTRQPLPKHPVADRAREKAMIERTNGQCRHLSNPSCLVCTPSTKII